jgi:hypothetical protein
MNDESPAPASSRRRFLNQGTAAVMGGVLCGAPGIVSAAPKRARKDGVAELPWPWTKIDAMEAGSRAFRYYHDVGG